MEPTRKKDTGEPGNPGEFGRSAHAASGLLLERPVDGTDRHVSMLAAALGEHLVNVTHRVETQHLCGAPAGAAWFEVTSDAATGEVAGADAPELEIRGYVFDDGGLRDVTMVQHWLTPEAAYASNSTTTPLQAATMQRLVADVPEAMKALRGQVRQQRFLDANVNDPQGRDLTILARISGDTLTFEGVRTGRLCSTALDLSRPEQDYAPALRPPGMTQVAVDPSSRQDVLDYLGREVLIAKGRFDLLEGNRPGWRHLRPLIAGLGTARGEVD